MSGFGSIDGGGCRNNEVVASIPSMLNFRLNDRTLIAPAEEILFTAKGSGGTREEVNTAFNKLISNGKGRFIFVLVMVFGVAILLNGFR